MNDSMPSVPDESCNVINNENFYEGASTLQIDSILGSQISSLEDESSTKCSESNVSRLLCPTESDVSKQRVVYGAVLAFYSPNKQLI